MDQDPNKAEATNYTPDDSGSEGSQANSDSSLTSLVNVPAQPARLTSHIGSVLGENTNTRSRLVSLFAHAAYKELLEDRYMCREKLEQQIRQSDELREQKHEQQSKVAVLHERLNSQQSFRRTTQSILALGGVLVGVGLTEAPTSPTWKQSVFFILLALVGVVLILLGTVDFSKQKNNE